jgi:hypothetical protein
VQASDDADLHVGAVLARYVPIIEGDFYFLNL